MIRRDLKVVLLIPTSIYGRDVRQAIHDAISTCYDDVTSPSLNTGAFYTAVQQAIDDGTLAVMEIQDGTITREKLSPDITFSIHYSDVPLLSGYTYLVEGMKYEIGAIAASSGGNTANTKRVRTVDNIPYSNSRGRLHVEFSASDVYKSAVLTHHPETTANTDSGWITSASFTRSIPADHYARMQFERLDGKVMTSEDITAIADALQIYCGDTTQTWLTNLLSYATSASANNLLKEGFQSLPGIALTPELAEHIVFRYPASRFMNGYYGTSGDWTAGTSNRYTTDRTHKIFLRAGTRISLEGGTAYPYIELKTGSREQIGLVYTLVEKYGMVKYCTWISFNLTLLAYVHDLDPRARLGYLGTPSEAGIQSFLALKTDQNEIFYDTTVGSITEANCKACQDVGIHMEGWTTSDRATIIRCSKIGVSGITTDDAHAQHIIQNQ